MEKQDRGVVTSEDYPSLRPQMASNGLRIVNSIPDESVCLAGLDKHVLCLLILQFELCFGKRILLNNLVVFIQRRGGCY